MGQTRSRKGEESRQMAVGRGAVLNPPHPPLISAGVSVRNERVCCADHCMAVPPPAAAAHPTTPPGTQMNAKYSTNTCRRSSSNRQLDRCTLRVSGGNGASWSAAASEEQAGADCKSSHAVARVDQRYAIENGHSTRAEDHRLTMRLTHGRAPSDQSCGLSDQLRVSGSLCLNTPT